MNSWSNRKFAAVQNNLRDPGLFSVTCSNNVARYELQTASYSRLYSLLVVRLLHQFTPKQEYLSELPMSGPIQLLARRYR